MTPWGWWHTAGGLTLLALGAYLMLAPKKGAAHRVSGELYFWLLAATCGSAMVIGAQHPGLSVLEVITPVTLAFGLLGYVAGKGRPFRWRGRSWLYWHLLGQGGSYIGIITAFGLQTVPRFVPASAVLTTALWLIPTLAGRHLIRRTARRWLHPATGEAVER